MSKSHFKGQHVILSPTKRGRRPSREKPSEMQIIYLKEGVNSLFILSIHVVLRKQLKVWRESFAWSNIPGITGRGQGRSERFVAGQQADIFFKTINLQWLGCVFKKKRSWNPRVLLCMLE